MRDIIKLIAETDNPNDLRQYLDKYHPYDIAEVLPDLREEDLTKLSKIYNTQEMAEIYSFLDEDNTEIFENQKAEYTASIMNEMPNDDVVDIYLNMDEETQNEILNLVDEDTKQSIIKLSSYDEDCAGSIMTTDFITVFEEDDVKDAMKKLISNAPNVEVINTIFVVDEMKRLSGVLDLKKLISTASPCMIRAIMSTNFQKASPLMDIEEAVEIIKDYDLFALPVIENDMIIGIITVDDAMERYNEEAGLDYAQFSGLTAEEDYDDNTIASIKKRIPWLTILLILNIFVILIISSFEEAISVIPILVIFQPIILGLAGNSGTQSLAVAVRKVANGELNTKKKEANQLFGELLIGMFQGLIIGLVVFVITILILMLSSESNAVIIAAIVALSIFCALSVSCVLGTLLPIVFTRLKIDPAVASGPFITTINDILSVLIYYGLAFSILVNNII